ncbi:MAG: hypothetical protein ACXWJM_04725 [Ramlibacter sp.]
MRREAARIALAGFAVALTAATLAWLIDGLDRGLELTDESYYLLSALHARDIRLFFTPFHWVSGMLWTASDSLVAFRAWGLGLACASAMTLAWAVLHAAPRAGMSAPEGRLSRAAVMASAASGALTYGSLLSFTPSYNLLAASGACLSVAFGLLSTDGSAARARTFEFLAGVALGVTFLCKFSAGICVGGLVMVLQVAFASDQRPRWRAVPFLIAVYAAATVALAAWVETGFGEALREFKSGIEIVWIAQGDGGTLQRLVRSATDLIGMLRGAGASFWGPLACLAIGLRWRPALFGIIGLAWFAVLLAAGRGHLTGGESHFERQAMPLVAVLVFALIAGVRQWTRTWRAVLLTATLAVLPVAVAIGTSNPLQVQVLGAMASWGALIGLLGSSHDAESIAAAPIGILFCAIVAVQVVTAGAEPYRMRPMPQQTEAITLPSLGSVKVDAETAALVREMQRAARACALPPGTPFLDFYDVPGVALMIGAVPVETPWLLHSEYAKLALRQADPAVLRGAAVAVKVDSAGRRPSPPTQLPGFPLGYKLCGRAVAPLDGRGVELWAPL